MPYDTINNLFDIVVPLPIIPQNKIYGKIIIMDRERKKRVRTIKLIFTEIAMVIVIIATVIVLTFLAMGYNVDKNGELGQSGLVQVKSVPSGATIEVDGETLISHTNASRMLSAGQHALKLAKDNYDTWSKEITSEPGILLKLEYPRLFLKERTMEKVREYEDGLEFISFSDDGSQILYAKKGDTNYRLLNIQGDDVSERTLDVSKLVGQSTPEEFIWDENHDKVLILAKNSDHTEYILLNLRDINASLNLTTEFKMSFSKVSFMAPSGERLAVLENGNLRQIAVGDKTISQVIAENVEDYYNRDTTIAYVGKHIVTLGKSAESLENVSSEKFAPETKTIRGVMLYQESTSDILLAELKDESKVKLALSDYLGKKYLSFSVDNHLYIYRGAYPVVDNMLSEMELVMDAELPAAPEVLAVWSEDQLIMTKSGHNIAMFDSEIAKLSQYEVEHSRIFFPADHLVGVIVDGKLVVRDFDGTNCRELSNVTTAAVISKNDKWLYYDLIVDGKTNIFREKIVE